jgi:hypothetical protein
MQALLKLRRFAKRERATADKCELCGAPIEGSHQHVVEVEKRRLLCSCRPCFLLFTHPGAGAGKLRSVSERYLKLTRVEIPDDEVPVGMVFFVRDAETGGVKAFYPSPAGATEAEVSSDAWQEMAARTPALATMEAGVEAALIARTEAWIVPVDACYELVGRIRRTWRGLDGGSDARREIDDFFNGLTQRETGCP